MNEISEKGFKTTLNNSLEKNCEQPTINQKLIVKVEIYFDDHDCFRKC